MRLNLILETVWKVWMQRRMARKWWASV